jgi:hypothetical protein
MLQAIALGEHLACVERRGLVRPSQVHCSAPSVSPERRRYSRKIWVPTRILISGSSKRGLSAVLRELFPVIFRQHLHQPLGAENALGNRVESGFDGDDGENQQRVDPMLRARAVRARTIPVMACSATR